jgi:hypothetical protein
VRLEGLGKLKNVMTSSRMEAATNVVREFPWKRKEKWPLVRDGGLIPGQTGRLTIDHKVSLTI